MDTTRVEQKPERVSPWPDGPDRSLGLFPIVTIGYSTKDRDIDFAINSAADDDMTPAYRALMVETLQALVRHFEQPALGSPEGQARLNATLERLKADLAVKKTPDIGE